MPEAGHYHCSIDGVGRGKGASVMHKAAYRSGERLFDQRSGQWTADYRKRLRSVIDKFIVTQEGAAAWRCNRQRLWNAAEAAEARSNGRIATELELGLPHELDQAQRKKLLLDFLAPIITRHGIAADVAIHTAHDDRNIHAHVLLTHRALGADGFGEIANARTIRKKIKGQVKLIGIAGIAATPADVEAIRKAWADAVNRAYVLAGLKVRVDHRSFDRRGIEDVPGIHLGPKASAMERRQPGSSDRGDINRGIELHNAHRRKLRQLRAEGRRLMQRQAQASAPRGGEIQIARPPAALRAREFSPRPEIAVEARQAPKRPAGEMYPGLRRRPSAASRAGGEADFRDG
jgi:ATP-dependent exoDNAse (exonuclease V) alpha subunit